MAQTDSGNMSSLANEADRAAEAVGGALTTAVGGFLGILKDGVSGVADFAEKEKELTAGVTAFGATISGVAAAVGVYSVVTTVAAGASTAFVAALATVAPWAVALAALAGIIVATTTETRKQAAAQEEMNQKAKEYAALLNSNTTYANIEQKKEAVKAIDLEISRVDALMAREKEMHSERIRLQKEYEESVAKEQRNDSLVEKQFEVMQEQERVLNELKETARKYNIVLKENTTAEEARTYIMAGLERQQREFNESLAIQNETIEEAVEEARDLAKEINSLESAYKTLIDGQSLSLDTMLGLIDTYPTLANYIATTGDLTLKNGEILKTVARTEAELNVETLRQSKAMTEAEIRNAKSRLTAYQFEMAGKVGAYIAFSNVVSALDPNPEVKSGLLDALTAAEAELDNINAQIAVTQGFLDNIESFGASDEKSSKNAKKEENEALKEQLKLLDQKKGQTEMSAQQEIAALEEIRNAHAKTEDEISSINERIYSLRLKALETWKDAELDAIKKMNKGRDDNTDFSAIIKAVQELRNKIVEEYKNYPESILPVLKELEDVEVNAAQSRSDKVLAIEKAAFDKTMSTYDDLIEYYKAMDGMTMPDGSVFKSGDSELGVIDLELSLNQKLIDSLEEVKAAKEAADGSLSDAEHARLEEAYNYKESLIKRHALLSIQLEKTAQAERIKNEKETQKELEKIQTERIKAIETILKGEITLEKNKNKEIISGIKERYSQEIEAAKAAADAEVKIIEGRIAEIDALMKQEDRTDKDEEYFDKLNRLQEQLKFELDDGNKYELQKEMVQLTEEYEKRKRTEGFEDEKQSLKDQVQLAKDNLTEQIKNLEALRDAEIKASEETSTKYIEELEKRIAADMEENGKLTTDLSKNLDTRLEDAKKFYDKKYIETKKNAEKEEASAKSTAENIINMLLGKVSEFADAGRQSGEAWIDAWDAVFNEHAANISAEIENYSGAASGQSAASGTSAEKASLNINNNFNVPVVTPSRMATVQEQNLQDYLRHM